VRKRRRPTRRDRVVGCAYTLVSSAAPAQRVNVVSFDSRAGAGGWATAGAAPAVTQMVAASAVAARAFGLTP